MCDFIVKLHSNIFILLLFLSGISLAQDHQFIKGQLVDSKTGEPVVFVSPENLDDYWMNTPLKTNQ